MILLDVLPGFIHDIGHAFKVMIEAIWHAIRAFWHAIEHLF